MRAVAAALLLVAPVSIQAQAPSVRDSAGIRILDYRGITPARSIVVSSAPVATVGTDGSGPAELLNGVVGAARLSSGRLVIAQSAIAGQRCGATGCTLKGSLLAAIYDSTGRTQSIFGRMGSGPGELSQEIVGLRVLSGDTIVLADQRAGIILYDRAGKYISQLRLTDAALRGSPMLIGFAPGGDLVGLMRVGPYTGGSMSKVPEGLVSFRDTLVIKRFDRSGIAGSTVATLPGDSISFTHTFTKTSDGVRHGMRSSPGRSLMPALCWNSSICKGTGNGNDVAVYSGGRLTQILRLPPPAAAELAKAPVSIVEGPRDELWVRATSDGVSRWWVLAQDGRVVATADLGKTRLLQVGGDFVVVLRTDADGVEVVEVRRTTAVLNSRAP
jgi:hypothetical protein